MFYKRLALFMGFNSVVFMLCCKHHHRIVYLTYNRKLLRMMTREDKAFKNQNQSVAGRLEKLSHQARPTVQLLDNRSEAMAQKTLHEIANDNDQVKQLRLYQEMADHHRSQTAGKNDTLQTKFNSSPAYKASEKHGFSSDFFSNHPPIQRIIGAAETAKEGESLDFTIDRVAGSKHRFRTKHVADSKEEALVKTQARIDLGGIFGRRTPNFCAKEEDWTTGIHGSKSVVPPEGAWEKEHGNVSYTFENSLLNASVKGWMVRDASKKDTDAIDLKAVEGSTTQSLGGDWSISGLDESGETVTGDANVDVDIFHVDGH